MGFIVSSSIVKVARKMTNFNPPFFVVPLYLPLLTPKEVKAPTFSGTHILRGLKLVIFQPLYGNGNGIKFWLVHVFPSKVWG